MINIFKMFNTMSTCTVSCSYTLMQFIWSSYTLTPISPCLAPQHIYCKGQYTNFAHFISHKEIG